MASSKEWIRFFVDAKIPKEVAEEYAVKFSKNRIGFDVLEDLNKVRPL